MGTLFHTSCNNCNQEDTLSWGDGIFTIQYQCCTCFKLFNIPRKAPRPNREGRDVPKFLEKSNFKSLAPIPTYEIIRFTEENLMHFLEARTQWQFGDDEWDSFEVEQLIALIACKCDSEVKRVDANLQLRYACKKCSFLDLQLRNIGTTD